MSWVVTLLNENVVVELSALPADMRARFSRIVMLIEKHGLERIHEPHVKHLEDRLWEIRLNGRDGIARAIYVTASGKRVVVVRVFTKKSQKTPHSELEVARTRAKEIK
jgi:phage-related protein